MGKSIEMRGGESVFKAPCLLICTTSKATFSSVFTFNVLLSLCQQAKFNHAHPCLSGAGSKNVKVWRKMRICAPESFHRSFFKFIYSVFSKESERARNVTENNKKRKTWMRALQREDFQFSFFFPFFRSCMSLGLYDMKVVYSST